VRNALCPALVLTTGWAALFCSGAISGDRAIARVNNEAITCRQFTAAAPAPSGDSAKDRKSRENLLDQMIAQKLFVQRARELGYEETLAGALAKKKADLLRARLENYARNLTPKSEDFARESALFVTEVHLKLIEVPTFDTARLIGMLLKQGVPFESLAVRYNRAQFTQPDGDLGFSPLGNIPPEIARAVIAMKEGENSDLIVRRIYYDFIKLAARRPAAKADSVGAYRQQIEAVARQRKGVEFIQSIRDQVSYDEEALDYVTRMYDSLAPADSQRVVARLKSGYKTRMGGLAAIVKGYPGVFPALRRKALKEDIENDVLEKEALRLGLDKTTQFRDEYRKAAEAGIYQYFYAREISNPAAPSDSGIADYFERHPELYGGRKLEQAAPEIRNRLLVDRRQQLYQSLLSDLRGRARITIDSHLLAQAKPEKK
jgi:hypothetical protein